MGFCEQQELPWLFLKAFQGTLDIVDSISLSSLPVTEEGYIEIRFRLLYTIAQVSPQQTRGQPCLHGFIELPCIDIQIGQLMQKRGAPGTLFVA